MDALKLRIDTGVRKIEVNDNGDYIMLQVADQSVPWKLEKFFNDIKDKTAKLTELSGSEDNKEAFLELTYELNVFAKESVDNIFGADTCKKALGDIIPPFEMSLELANDLVQYFIEYAESRVKKLSKYSPDRMGSAE